MEIISTYRVSFLKVYQFVACPVEGCHVILTIWTKLRIHFGHLHVRDTVDILDEVNLSRLRCTHCSMFELWLFLKVFHPNTALCTMEVERKQLWMYVEEAWAVAETVLWAYGRPLTKMDSFK